jgi:hypothetical protein
MMSLALSAAGRQNAAMSVVWLSSQLYNIELYWLSPRGLF